MEEITKYELTAKDFEEFKSTARKWVDTLSLHDWEIDFQFTDAEGNIAQCRVNREGRRVTLVLSDRWYNEEPTEERIREAALHEVLELLLDDLWFVFGHEIDEDARKCAEMTRASHAVIHRLQRVLK